LYRLVELHSRELIEKSSRTNEIEQPPRSATDGRGTAANPAEKELLLMSDRSNVITQLKIERERQDREWERVFTALQALDPQLTFGIQRTVLDELDGSFKPKRSCVVPTNALRA
jgi:hypothetical protein